MNQNELVGKCTNCGKEIPVEYLSFLPKTESYYRNLGNPSNAIKEKEVNSNILLCPDCMAKWEQAHAINK